MITIYNELDAQQLTDPELQRLVRKHLDLAKKNGLEALTVIAVIEPADSEAAVVAELGFSPMHNRLTDKRFGDPGFTPSWDWMAIHPKWYELVFTAGDSGFAFIVLVPQATSPMDALCRQFASLGRPET